MGGERKLSWLTRSAITQRSLKEQHEVEGEKLVAEEERQLREKTGRVETLVQEASNYLDIWRKLEIDDILKDLRDFLGGDGINLVDLEFQTRFHDFFTVTISEREYVGRGRLGSGGHYGTRTFLTLQEAVGRCAREKENEFELVGLYGGIYGTVSRYVSGDEISQGGYQDYSYEVFSLRLDNKGVGVGKSKKSLTLLGSLNKISNPEALKTEIDQYISALLA